MEFGIPQLIWLALMTFTLGVEATKHGKPKEENYNFWARIIASALVFGLLYWGGFFS